MLIKHKASLFIAALLGGLVFVWFPVAIMISVGEFHFLMAFLVAFGCAFSFFGVYGLSNRSKNAIRISEHGISQITGDAEHRIHVSDIQSITTFADIRGRGVTISLTNGTAISFDCRHFCSVRKFIKYCKKANLPCA